MGFLICKCGYKIRDNSNNQPDVADILCQQDVERTENKFIADVNSFITAIQAGKREEWIRQRFLSSYPTDLDDGSIISDLLMVDINAEMLGAYQCQNCGRIHIQAGKGTNLYRSFTPDGEWKGTFESVENKREEVATQPAQTQALQAIRDHKAFLNSYSPKDEGLYDD